MGGFFGAVAKKDVISDVFFGTDYHSHLGTYCGGMAAFDATIGLQREIHHIQNSPFRTKFEHVFNEMKGTAAIGCITDEVPQPLLICSRLGTYAITVIGRVNNAADLIQKYLLESGGHFSAMTGGRINYTELIAALINQKESFAEGIRFAQSVVDGTASILLLRDTGTLIAARDRLGRLPVIIGKADEEEGFCVSFESFPCHKLGYTPVKELGPGEIVELSADGMTQLSPPGKEMRMCTFLWAYFGYPTSTYEGSNVEVMRTNNGRIMAENDKKNGKLPPLDYVSGVPDSGTPHALGYSAGSGVPFARPYIKYTPTWSRSFTPPNQAERRRVAKMKQIPIHELIRGKDLLFVDDSIVRGTQLQGTVDFLHTNGAISVHMRSACPPLMYPCKYLNFSRSTSPLELLTRKIILELEGEVGEEHIEEYSDPSTERGKRLRQAICDKFHFASLEFQTLEGLIEAIGIDEDRLCTYCWNHKE